MSNAHLCGPLLCHRGFSPRRVGVAGALAASLLFAPATWSSASEPGPGGTPIETGIGVETDSLSKLIKRIEKYFRQHEIDGVTQDLRYPLNPSEVVRLSIVSQLLGYNDLYAAHPKPRYYEDVVSHADFLVLRFNEIISGTAFDGMLGYAMLGAYEVTGSTAYLDKGTFIVNRLLRMPLYLLPLNGGLMGAMALAKYYELTGDARALGKAQQIIAAVSARQHPDGSFPHYCPSSKDIHYTAWMAMELVTIRRSIDYPLIDAMLLKANAFLLGRVGSNGVTSYSSCQGGRCTHYYSIGTGCPQDYDTRAWINELGYNALVFDHFAEPRYGAVIGFLSSLTDNGTMTDKWDFFPPPSDPVYPWATGDPSIIRSSVVFWSLASIQRDRDAGEHDHFTLPLAVVPWPRPPLADGDEPPGDLPPPDWPVWTTGWQIVDSLMIVGADPSLVCRPPPKPATLAVPHEAVGPGRTARLSVAPNPARVETDVTFELARGMEVGLGVFDVNGRLVRTWMTAWYPAGRHHVAWDLKDRSGQFVASGLYFVRMRGPVKVTAKVLVDR